MELEAIKKLLNSDTYSFLRENEHLKDRLMILTLGGSHAYGTHNENSDLDIRGVAAEGISEILGLSNFEQFENRETDTVIYALRKIISLMLNCNPNTIEIMGTKPEQIFYISEEGKLLRDNIDLFLSQKARYAFGGYANQQLRRLQNALARDSYPQGEKEEHILKSVQNQMFDFENRYKQLTGGSIHLFTDVSDKEDFEREIFANIQLAKYPLRDLNAMFSEMNNTIKEYAKLNHRNTKKDEPHLLKHAMHLVRLYLMGTEILSGKGINTYRENDRDLLLAIRNGKYSYDQVFEMVNKLEKEFDYAVLHSPLPQKPDYKKVEGLVMEINKVLLKKYLSA